MTLKLKYKIVLLAALSALLPVLAVSLLMYHQKETVKGIIEGQLSTLTEEGLRSTTFNLYEACEMAHNLMLSKVNYDLNVARRMLKESGGLKLLSTESVKWEAVNQFTQAVETVSLPRALIGGSPVDKNWDFAKRTPVVDETTELAGGTCTIFQRMNKKGDMLRIATSVPQSDGKRAIGTFIPATAPGGKPNPIVAAVLDGKIYNGRAYVVNTLYISAYEPIRDATGAIIGCLYVGVKVDSMRKIEGVINKLKVGKTGYVCALGGTGSHKGEYIISRNGDRNGQNILDSRDAEGRFFIKDMIEKAVMLKPGEFGFIDYSWRNSESEPARLKKACYIYFEPWDWVLMTTMYHDDYDDMHEKVSDSINSLLLSVVLGGLALIAISSAIAFLLGGRISAPIARISEMARLIASGDISSASLGFKRLSGRISESGDFKEGELGNDETGSLISSIVTMTKNLNSLVAQVQRSTIQIVSSTMQIAASAKEQEAIVTEFGASTNEIVSSSKEISATSMHLVSSMDDVAAVSNRTAELADNGRTSLEGMHRAMEQLAFATESISAKLSIINEKANNISNVVVAITKVASQTNLLSLNASIEAEKAGEFGKGFSVVAREIRRLADQTAVATLDITRMVKDMQSAVSSGVMEMDKFSEEVRNGVRETDAINFQLERIMEEVHSLPPVFNNVIDGMKQQASGAQQISEAMVQLSEAARQTAESLREFNDATVQLNNATHGLQREVSVFRVRE